MARALDVYVGLRLIGQLIQDDGGQMRFRYGESWLSDPQAFPISCSLPLREAAFTQRECRGFFGGILPEEGNRRVIARVLGISDRNDFAMLERLGGECAGALTFLPEGERPEEPGGAYRELTRDELADILRILPKRPLLAGEKGVRLSLAGAQDKLAVKLAADGRIALPLDYAPSTHILKPALSTWEGLVANEAFCMGLARAVGLAAAETSAHAVDGIEYLLSQRFDRAAERGGGIRRLHQEDFCQALGVPSEMKYQAEGGPGLKACFALLRRASSNLVADVRALLDAITFNLLIGNNDAHAKNFSLLYGADGDIRLAPLYDLVSTVFYPEIENRLAMKIGGNANPDTVSADEVELFAREAGLGPAQTRRNMVTMAERVRDAVAHVDRADETAERLAGLVLTRCEGFLARTKR